MRFVDISRTQFKLSDFIGWQREGSLRLSPSFQRRPVWKKDAKSFLVDSVVRGLPVPVIYLRERIDLKRQETVREVVDGQQRLRTLLGFVNPKLLNDFNPERDQFLVSQLHNPAIADTPFSKFPDDLKKRILSYEFSTHTLPSGIEDREILQMFARLNATGVKLNDQELRNAEWFGAFKAAMYELALEQLEGWRAWGVLSEDQIARMKEVEVTSDLVMNMIDGLTGKTQKRIDDLYKRYDKKFTHETVVRERFRRTMEAVDVLMRGELSDSVFVSEVHFFSLWVYLYDVMWGLGSVLNKTKPRLLPSQLAKKLATVSAHFAEQTVPKAVLDAVQRASADLGRRRTRLQYMHKVCGI
jgi:hypothetical protein